MAHTYSTNTLTFVVYIKREVRNIPNKWILVLWIIFLFSSSTSLFFPVQRGLCQSFILISSALWYRSCIYTSTEQSIIRLIPIMCSSKNNSNAKKLCNWINESRCHTVENVDKSAFERKLKTEEFKIIKTHTHTCTPFTSLLNGKTSAAPKWIFEFGNQIVWKNWHLSNQNYARSFTISGSLNATYRTAESAHSQPNQISLYKFFTLRSILLPITEYDANWHFPLFGCFNALPFFFVSTRAYPIKIIRKVLIMFVVSVWNRWVLLMWRFVFDATCNFIKFNCNEYEF